jgi:CMP-N,N'-diacetyllegionaminic acid synthase
MTHDSILVTICARGGSKGLPSKNIRPFLGKPLIAHTIDLAKRWSASARVVVSTDSEEIAQVARRHGAETPFVRPAELATDSAGKLPVIVHALRESERIYGQRFDTVLDMDPSSPFRRLQDIEMGFETFTRTGADTCFSVVKARKNPYFNMVERGPDGKIHLVKEPGRATVTRQEAPQVWDMNASIYLFRRAFLLSSPASLWVGAPEIFEMPPESAFDIDLERDLVVTEALMRHCGWTDGKDAPK